MPFAHSDVLPVGYLIPGYVAFPTVLDVDRLPDVILRGYGYFGPTTLQLRWFHTDAHTTITTVLVPVGPYLPRPVAMPGTGWKLSPAGSHGLQRLP